MWAFLFAHSKFITINPDKKKGAYGNKHFEEFCKLHGKPKDVSLVGNLV